MHRYAAALLPLCATATSAMQHVAMAEAQDGTAVNWLEHVADDSDPR